MPFSPPGLLLPSSTHGTFPRGFPASVAFHSSQPHLHLKLTMCDSHLFWTLQGFCSMHLQVSLPLAYPPNPETRKLSLQFLTGHQGRGEATQLWAADFLPGPSTEDRGHIQRNMDSQKVEGLPPRKAPPPQYSRQLAADFSVNTFEKEARKGAELSPGVPSWPPSRGRS